ncbi:hypothetical protein HPB47_009583, partial [Ixodes persulcatus]
KVTAKLANIAFQLVRTGGGQSDEDSSFSLLCAVTEELSTGANCLLLGVAWVMLNEATALPPNQSGESAADELCTNGESETDPTEGEALGQVLGLSGE